MTSTTGEREVVVPAERLARWVAGFVERHGRPEVDHDQRLWTLRSPDGAEAVITHPFSEDSPAVAADADSPEVVDALVADLVRDRRLGVLLVRRSAHAVGVLDGPRLVTSSVDRHYVQGRTKAGGWSQQRYARRRANQASKAWDEAADDAAALLLPEVGRLAAVVCGGDKASVRAVLADERLAPLASLVQPRVWPTPDPRKQVLLDFVSTARAVPIRLNAAAQELRD